MVAARRRIAAPFGAGIADETPRLVETVDQRHRVVPRHLGDVEIVGGVPQHVQPRHVAAIGQIVQGVVGAHRIVGMDVQIGVQHTRRGGVDGDEGRSPGQAGGFGADPPFPRLRQGQIIQAQHRPALGGQGERANGTFAVRRGQRQRPGHIFRLASVAPLVLGPQQQRNGARRRQAGRYQTQGSGRAGHHVHHAIARNLGIFLAAQRIDEDAETEGFLDEGLHPRSRPALTAVAQPHHDAVAGIEVTVDDVDDHRLLIGPFMPLLVETHLQRLHRRRALPRHQFGGLIFGRDVIGRLGIAGLEQRPVGIELDGQLDAGTVGQHRGADFVDQLQLGPFPGYQPVVRAGC